MKYPFIISCAFLLIVCQSGFAQKGDFNLKVGGGVSIPIYELGRCEFNIQNYSEGKVPFVGGTAANGSIYFGGLQFFVSKNVSLKLQYTSLFYGNQVITKRSFYQEYFEQDLISYRNRGGDWYFNDLNFGVNYSVFSKNDKFSFYGGLLSGISNFYRTKENEEILYRNSAMENYETEGISGSCFTITSEVGVDYWMGKFNFGVSGTFRNAFNSPLNYDVTNRIISEEEEYVVQSLSNQIVDLSSFQMQVSIGYRFSIKNKETKL